MPLRYSLISAPRPASVKKAPRFAKETELDLFIPCCPLGIFPETPLRSALTAGWISIGNLWMFGGLLAAMKKAKEIPV